MSYSRVNYYRKALDVVECHNKHYIEGVSTYRGVWKKYIRNTFYIGYSTYRKILEESGLEGKYREELAKEERRNNGEKL